jgi:hypothetical protein
MVTSPVVHGWWGPSVRMNRDETPNGLDALITGPILPHRLLVDLPLMRVKVTYFALR